MSPLFREGDGLGEELAHRYAEAWSTLPVDTRAALETCDGMLDPVHVQALIQAPNPLVTLTYWLQQPEEARWNVAPTFLQWVREEASGASG